MKNPAPTPYQQQLEDKLAIAHERIWALEKEIGIRVPYPSVFKLTTKESIVFGMLMQREVVRREALMLGLYGDRDANRVPDENVLVVFLHKIRRKLKPFGVDIQNAWGSGWFILPADKAKVRALGAEQKETA